MVRGNLYIRRDQVWKTVRAPETAQLCRLTEAPISVFLSCLNPFKRSLLIVGKLSHQFLHWIHKRILCLVIKTQSQPPCNKQTDIFVPNVNLGNDEVSRLRLKCLSCGSRFTYEIAPVFVLMEQLTLKKMKEIVGWPGGEGDGIFSPGLCGSCD